jgi:hypothetical protein
MLPSPLSGMTATSPELAPKPLAPIQAAARRSKVASSAGNRSAVTASIGTDGTLVAAATRLSGKANLSGGLWPGRHDDEKSIGIPAF